MRGHVDVVLDAAYGSSGKGKLSTWLADHKGYAGVSSANFPNAGHTALRNGFKFVAKAIPTAAMLWRDCEAWDCAFFLTPGSGFTWSQLTKEWKECGKPPIYIHERACVLTDEHAAREREGAESTAHIASTMQGTAAAMTDKILRKQNAPVAAQYSDAFLALEGVHILQAQKFRDAIHDILSYDDILHEGSQGYALSIDHGSHYPQCTSRNCTTAAALDYLGVAPQRLGDVWLNIRSYPIRVGNIAQGSSGDFYPDSQEITWAEVAARAGMPYDETIKLAERERTTVTKRIRRVATFSWQNLEDAVRTNGATKLCLNFAQYIDWSDNGKRDFDKLTRNTREFVDEIETRTGLPVALIGTGADHEDMVVREEYV